jgi:GNAT superfamily N-acetyltransferase
VTAPHSLLDGDSVRVRPARADELDAILDLLMDYDLPRSVFEPWYIADPTYRPEHSWVVEDNGRLVAHLRIYERDIDVGGPVLHVAGIGNVITAHSARGRGHARRLLETTLAELPRQGFDYSLLWTHLPTMYKAFGWATLPELEVLGIVASDAPSGWRIRSYTDADRSDVMQLYAELNAGRSGYVVRSPELWQGQLEVLRAFDGVFLVARDPAGHLQAYVRGVPSGADFELHEIAFHPNSRLVARGLLRTSGAQRIHGPVPPSITAVFEQSERELSVRSALMGRTLNLDTLLARLLPVWCARIADRPVASANVTINTSAGAFRVDLSVRGLTVETVDASESDRAALNEGEFAYLLWRGWDSATPPAMADHPAAQMLEILFPARDFGIWAADAF